MTLLLFSKRPTLELFRQLPMNEIVWLEGERNYTYIHFRDGSRALFSKTLQQMDTQLPIDMFGRINKGITVNLQLIKRVNVRAKYIQLSCGLILPISRRRVTKLKVWWRSNQTS